MGKVRKLPANASSVSGRDFTTPGAILMARQFSRKPGPVEKAAKISATRVG